MRSSLKISASFKHSRTCLQQCYFTPPFKVANITADKNAKTLDLMLMCSSPGILDNDVYDFEIMVEENASLQLHTQSYQRLFHMKHGASQKMQVHLQAGATFVYLPHPAVPHASSIFKNTNNIYLQNNCTLFWGEIITCGRQLKGEVFSFSKYHNITQIYLNDKLVIRENLLMQPSVNNVQLIGQLEGFTHQASLIYLSNDSLLSGKMDTVYEWLLLKTGIEFGISKAPIQGFIVRILGYKAEQLHDCLKAISHIVLNTSILATGGG